MHFAQVKSERQQEASRLAEDDISAAQCRGARGMLGWNQNQLAEAANVSRMTVVEFEGGRRVPHSNNLAAIRSALMAAGVVFTGGDERGVKLRRSGT